MMPLPKRAAGWMSTAELAAHAVLEEQGQGLATVIPQPVRHAVRLQGVKALVVEKRYVQLVRRRIAIEHREQVGAHCVEDVRVASKASSITSRSSSEDAAGLSSWLAR
jgi:hypothetical protein